MLNNCFVFVAAFEHLFPFDRLPTVFETQYVTPFCDGRTVFGMIRCEFDDGGDLNKFASVYFTDAKPTHSAYTVQYPGSARCSRPVFHYRVGRLVDKCRPVRVHVVFACHLTSSELARQVRRYIDNDGVKIPS